MIQPTGEQVNPLLAPVKHPSGPTIALPATILASGENSESSRRRRDRLMVSETLLRTLNDAFIQAGNKRDRIQVEVNKQRERVNVARANLEHAQTRETNLVQQNQRKKAECKELVDHYNGLVDKSGLNAIQEWINELTAQQTEIHRRLQEAQEIRRQRYSELQQTETDLAVAEQNLGKALKDWQRMSAELKRARNEE